MHKYSTDRTDMPVDERVDEEVVGLQALVGGKSPLDEHMQQGAKRMLQAAIDAEVDAFIERHHDRRGTIVNCCVLSF